MPRLFIDLDDVLADFELGAALALGMSRQDYVDLHGERVMWKHIEATPEFYRLLPWRVDGWTLWQGLPAGVMPMVLSGMPGAWADRPKRDWCSRELGAGTVVITCPTVDRAKYCVGGDVLVGAHERDRLDWETAGGAFVLHRDAAGTLARLGEIF